MAKNEKPGDDGKGRGVPRGDEIDWDDIDFDALDRANDKVGAQGPDGLGDPAERAGLIADILGGTVGKRALKALPPGKRKPKG